MSKRVLIIGAGAVGGVTTHKCAQFPEYFSEVCLASRTLEKCEAIAKQLKRKIQTRQLDADKPENVEKLIKEFKADMVINVALPYQNLSIMDACKAAGVHYVDTACYEPIDDSRFSYKWQWPYHDSYKSNNIMGLLGCGFDPGVTNVFVAYAKKHFFDTIKTLDILDCNGGDHGLPFATNFNPEINLRELDADGRYWQNGDWQTIPAMSIKQVFDFPEVGPKDMYLIYHEELETLTKHFPEIERARFWMTFGQSYINHLNAFKNVGLTSIEPIKYNGTEIVPIQFLKALLPDPASLGPRTKGKTNIGCIITGTKDGVETTKYIYQICDHQECYKEVQSQGVAYTAGVPPAIGAALLAEGIWLEPGVFNCEQMDPDPFMELMAKFGLPWHITDATELG
ncbi:MAG: saccharopine dehydrogenase family protein [Bdellovibrionota bacterium]